jgi:hypothetical protein
MNLDMGIDKTNMTATVCSTWSTWSIVVLSLLL